MPENHSSIDDIIAIYERDIDVTLLLENLKLSPDQRLKRMTEFGKFVTEMYKAGERNRAAKRPATNVEASVK